MSVNKYKPHLMVLPEDLATSEIANGFLLNPNLNIRTIQVLPYCDGWPKVLDAFKKIHAREMQKNPNKMIVLIVDFDRDEKRLSYIKSQITEEIKNRVFVLGVLSEPEDLRRDIQRNWESIGEALAKDCADNTNKLWGHDLLKHNRAELERMTLLVKPFLFN